MRNVLIVAYYFPPLGGIASVRMSRFVSSLPDYGWQVTVLAPSNGAYYMDPELDYGDANVLRSRSIEISRIGKRVLRTGGTDTRPARPMGIRHGLQVAARRGVYFPDSQIGWYWPAVRTGRSAMRSRAFDAIFSSANPVTAHLIARRLHRDSGIPWVVEYRDPFSELAVGAINRRRAARLERSIAREAASLVTVSPNLLTHADRWYERVTVITNGCDGAISAVPGNPDRFTITHLGTLYPSWQDLTGFWQAVGELSETRLRFIGDPQVEVRDQLDGYGLSDRVEVTGMLPRTRATALLAEADALLMAGPKDDRMELRGWSSGKVFEYLATDLPIIYVGDPHCYAAQLLRGHPGCYVHCVHDVDGMMATLRRCRGERHRRDISAFTGPALACRLAQTLDEACAR